MNKHVALCDKTGKHCQFVSITELSAFAGNNRPTMTLGQMQPIILAILLVMATAYTFRVLAGLFDTSNEE